MGPVRVPDDVRAHTRVLAHEMSRVPPTAGGPFRLYLTSPRHSQDMDINGQMDMSTQFAGQFAKPFCMAIRAPYSL